ncbi:MAG: hypothetical protein QXD94_02450 [Sulfolobales archaeon]
MSLDLDRLMRLIDSIDFKSYTKLVLTSSKDDLNCLINVLGTTDVVYILINNNVAANSQVRDELWIRRLTESVNNSLTKVKYYIINELSEVLVFIDLKSPYLHASYEALRELKEINRNSRAFVIIKIPPNPSELDFINLLTYVALVTKESLSNYVLITSSRLLDSLKLLYDGNTLAICINTLLKFSPNIERYLAKYRKVGVFTCFPRANLEVFGNLTNIVRFTHHMMNDFTDSIDSALMLIIHNLKDLNSEVNYMKARLKINELELVGIKSEGKELTVLTVEPNNSLILELRRFITKTYELIKEMELNISPIDLTNITG